MGLLGKVREEYEALLQQYLKLALAADMRVALCRGGWAEQGKNWKRHDVDCEACRKLLKVLRADKAAVPAIAGAAEEEEEAR